MSAGKYSPTVQDLGEFRGRCSEPGDIFDKEGFDVYGYNAEGKDRIGKIEFDYLSVDED